MVTEAYGRGDGDALTGFDGAAVDAIGEGTAVGDPRVATARGAAVGVFAGLMGFSWATRVAVRQVSSTVGSGVMTLPAVSVGAATGVAGRS